MKKTLIVSAPAKINIALWVKERRQDGFHELGTIFQTISLADTITLKETSEPGIVVFCDKAQVPCDASNLAHRAATIFFDHNNIEPQLAINIEKRIPVAAGLAGGSTDAAAVLTGLSRLYDKATDLSEIMKMAALIGSDVPFVTRGGLALAEGRGEKLNFFTTPQPKMIVVVAVPSGVAVSTRWAYENYSSGNNDLKEKVFKDSFEAYHRGDLKTLRKVLFNDLESVTLHRYPEVQQIKEALSSTSEGAVLMSGSGPSVFGLFDNRKSAMQAVRELKGLAVEIFIEHTIKRHL